MTDSKDIFIQYCSTKPEKANEFLCDYILYKLDVPVKFEGEKYKEETEYLLDYFVEADEIFNLNCFMVSLKIDEITEERYKTECKNQIKINDDNVISLLFNVFIANIDKFLIMKNKEISDFDVDELKDYKINIQYDFSNSKIDKIENKLGILLKLSKNDDFSEILEIDEENLGSIIDRLKEIYCQIKN